jgi:hypothetical protein
MPYRCHVLVILAHLGLEDTCPSLNSIQMAAHKTSRMTLPMQFQ